MTKTFLAISAATAALIATPALAATGIGDVVTLTRTGTVTATYLGFDADYDNTVGLVNNGVGDLFNNKTSIAGDTMTLGFFSAGDVLQFYLRSIVDSNTTNIFYTGDGSGNPDDLAHAAVEYIGSNKIKISWEDIYGGGDKDYNDLILTINEVPEPATWLMMLLGFGFAGVALRRSRVRNVAVSYS